MELLPSHKKILEYLNKHGSVNTFRLSKDLEINRGKLISLVKGLANEGLVIFRSGAVTKGDNELIAQKIKEAEREPVSKPTLKKTIKPKIIKEKQSELENVKGKAQRLKKEIEDLQTQRNGIVQKLAKERALFYQIRKEKKETEKNLRIWEESLSERERDIQKREKSIATAAKSINREKGKLKPKPPKKTLKTGKRKIKEKTEKQEKFELKKKEPKIEKHYKPMPEEQKVKDSSYTVHIQKLQNLKQCQAIWKKLMSQGKVQKKATSLLQSLSVLNLKRSNQS